jgi:ubiquinone biosynthesis protein COQ9
LPVICPAGVSDVVTAFCKAADDHLNALFTPEQLHSMRVRDRIALLVKERILWHQPYREATRRTVAYFMHPFHLADGQGYLWQSADTMWHLAGDNATDFNHYTKRSLLEYAYSTTLIFWLEDASPNYEHSWEFLDRRLQEVLKLGHHWRNIPETARRTLKRIPILRMLIPKRSAQK